MSPMITLRLIPPFLTMSVWIGGALLVAGQEAPTVYSTANEYVRLTLRADGCWGQLTDLRTGHDYCARVAPPVAAHVRVGDRDCPAVAAERDGQRLVLRFAETDARATLTVTTHPHHFVIEVCATEGDGVESLTLLDLPTTLTGAPEDPLSVCALALNLQTRVPELPRPVARPTALCYHRFGMVGARVALVVCPSEQLRTVLQEVVRKSVELPFSTIGGPWAQDYAVNRGSYLFDFGDLNEQTVDDWIKLARQLGIGQIDFHGGRSFRFGDCRPNPDIFPQGVASLKAVVDRLHAAGIKAGLHTYAFFLAKDTPWVTPVPDPRLGKDAAYTLAEPLTAEATLVPVREGLDGRSLNTGFFERNSLTLQIDDELIVYAGLSTEPPYAFTQCQRGALGTTPAAHAPGATVHHLKQCFFLFTPDPDSTLLAEVAQKTADVYNACGFDMMYLDALDGEGILGGNEYGWHYGSRFVFELFRRLDRHPVMEMSTFHHHLWYVRTRIGAWDHPNRSHKKFIDLHCASNAELARMFLPGHLGWWAVKTGTDIQSEPTFADDIEYLCGKCIAYDCGFSVMGVNPGNVNRVPVFSRQASIMRQYEELRHAGYFSAETRARLAEPGQDFTLSQGTDGRWQLRPAQYVKHKVEGWDDWTSRWQVENPYATQPVRLRIESLPSISPYHTPGSVAVTQFGAPDEFPDRAGNTGVSLELIPQADVTRDGLTSGALVGTRDGQVPRRAAWARLRKTFSPPLSLENHEGLGLWVHGDGKGEVLNVQLTSPPHVSFAISDHYVPIDFTGWRYVELVEPEGQRWCDYTWPYGGAYATFREQLDYRQVDSISLWYNNLPPAKMAASWAASRRRARRPCCSTARTQSPSPANRRGMCGRARASP